ncbi:hypothetical protein FE236_08090 [Mariprofundus erugo]|uniref:PAS domain-containing protein n=1 Tax=Mariprofundus erugo TaxID=2528639 RepID=A0A5R9GN51_9PROT|nr:hypothetical protein [Mariprofundus erugo]TLS67816.1 hypothetical protein FEF65_05030 [Mariprofundus erugo]TLS75938.1 hypothetical protein FE236_08090 [Mariprofundus erugo]
MVLTGEQMLVYQIDAQNRICALSENWLDFTNLNGADERCTPAQLIGRPLLSCFDAETACLYQLVIDAVRASGESIVLSIRCDSSSMRRLIRLEVHRLADGRVEFNSRLLWSEHRECMQLLRADNDLSDHHLPICSFCKKIRLDEKWLEVEQVTNQLRLFEAERMPVLISACCPDCSRMVHAAVDRIDVNRP